MEVMKLRHVLLELLGAAVALTIPWLVRDLIADGNVNHWLVLVGLAVGTWIWGAFSPTLKWLVKREEERRTERSRPRS